LKISKHFEPTLLKGIKFIILSTFFLTSAFLTNAQLKADFNARPTTGCAPLVALFNDASTGNPTSWFWDLGNGTTSTLQTPAAVYAKPGTYTVKLVVQNAFGIDSVAKVQYITVYSSPVVDLSGTPVTGCFPLPTHFTDLTKAGSGSISKWEWDFGDGTISTDQNPNHTYTSLGNYNITLKATNSFGCFSFKTAPSYIQIKSGAKADFTNSIPNSCKAPATINFTNGSVGTGSLNYQWDFGDGTTSTSPSPSHIYKAGGSYSVKLIVFNSIGCTDTLVKPNLITIGNTKADFDSFLICKGATYTINNRSTPAPGGAFWNFGDGTFSDSISPVKAFSDTGVFTIKMVANFGACKDSVTKNISVLGTPIVNFSTSPTSSCKAPFTVNFTNASTGGKSYRWDFGDGTTSTDQNPSHTYTTEGTFTVTSVVTNAAGCTDSLVKKSLVIIKAPVVTITGLPQGACPPLTRTFTAQVTSVDSIATYLWNFGDGNTSVQIAPSHTYSVTGKYTITLNYTTTGGCSGTVTVTDGISIGTLPKANFSATPLNVCASQPINFTDLSTGTPNSWIWLFGDGTNSSQQNPVHQYNDTGSFTVKLIALNNGCADTISFPSLIRIKPAVAKFTYSSACGTSQHVIFTDGSVGADSWTWNFGDGSPTSSVQNPVHDYALPGNYSVSLTVSNTGAGCSFTKTIMVQVVYEVPTFTVSNPVICKNSPVTFNAKVGNRSNVVLYTWTLGDGTTVIDSTGTITYKYTKTGTYNVTLTIKDINGCSNSVTVSNAVSVGGPTAVFRALVPAVCLNAPATFFDSSYTDGTHNIQRWNWNWGDGTSQTFTSPPFNHTYTSPGSFSVLLIVTDNAGCTDSVRVPNAILISKPIANFSGDTLSCTTRPANFLNASTGQGLTYLWNLGDGSNSTVQNPAHLYGTEGAYTISLNITDLFGCQDSITKINYLKVANPRADFIVSDSIASCPPLLVNFTNNSANFLTSLWDFGDGATSSARNPSHFYSGVGTFTATLTVTGATGCTSQKSIKIVVKGPSTSFSYSNLIGCKPLTSTFRVRTERSLTLLWDFGDGTALRAPDSVVTHTYSKAGSYLPKLIIVDTTGCSVLLNGADSIKAVGVTASFNNSNTIVCDAGNVQFTNTSTTNDIITNYNWNFGDGTTSTQQNPLHNYTVPGNYSTILSIITQQGCKDTISNPANVKVIKSPQISITGDAGACVPATLKFSGNLIVADTSLVTWKWDFANGQTSTLINPPAQNYTTAGTFTVKAIATNSSGCDGVATKIIEIYPLPQLITSGDTTICLGAAASLHVSGAESYVWSPANFLSCTNCANPFAQATTSTGYLVTGTSIHGCISSDSVNVTVKIPFKISVSTPDTLCLGSSVQLNATGAETYTWSPGTGLSNPAIGSPIASPVNSVTYQVIGTDSKGCFQDTGFVPISVFPLPVVNAGPDQTINVGQQTNIIPTISTDVTGVLWTPTTGIVSNNYPGITVKPTETTEYTIEVRSAVGCKATDKVSIFVLCNNANVFVPNTFSPNGDGVNDVFYPRGTGVFRIKNLRIFNRWGQIVFDRSNINANDPSAGWDGTLNGKKLPSDVFVYTLEVVCENNTTLVFKGNIALVN
jgi:gliding motility-associated-like protein